MKARFDVIQQKVSIMQLDGVDFIFICLNEKTVTEIPMEGEEEQTYYEYDYREISESTGIIDLEDVKENPEKYVDYKESKKRNTGEKIKELETKIETQGLIIQYLAEMADIYIPE
jgi:adenylate cyclase class IV